MFDAGFWEFLLIFVIALLVVGPERLPGLARKVGGFVGKARRYLNSVRSDVEREINSQELQDMLNRQESEIRELKTMLSDSQQDIRNSLDQTANAVSSTDADKKNLDFSSDPRYRNTDPDFDPSDLIEPQDSPAPNKVAHDSSSERKDQEQRRT